MRLLITIILLMTVTMAMCQRNHIVYEATFEPGTGIDFDSVACPENVTPINAIARHGSYSLRLSSASTDSCDPVRTQVMLPGAYNTERWFGFSLLLNNGYNNPYEGVEELLGFYRFDTGRLPFMTINYNGHYTGVDGWPSGRYITVVQSLVSPDSVIEESPYTIYHYPLDTTNSVEWLDIVINAKFVNDTSGFIRIWVNNELRFIYSGATAYGDNYIRLGPDHVSYREGMEGVFDHPRVMFVDEVRIGNSMATYLDVVPGDRGQSLPVRDGPIKRPAKQVLPLRVVNPIQSDELVVTIPLRVPERMSFEIVSVSGHVVARGQIAGGVGDNIFRYTVKHLPVGMYFFVLQSKEGLSIEKVIR